MTIAPDDNLERLISRFLDHEDTAADRRALNTRVDSDPAARAQLDEHVALDTEVRHALRQAMRRSYPTRVASGGIWFRIGRSAALAVAACLALMFWLSPGKQTAGPRSSNQPQEASIWAAPNWRNVMEQQRPPIDRPHVQRRDLQRDWIIIPGRRPGDGLVVIEINRVRTRAIAIQQDF